MVGTVPLQDVVDAIGRDASGPLDAVWVTGLPEPYRESQLECQWREGKVRYRFWEADPAHRPVPPWYRDFDREPGQARWFPPPLPPDMQYAYYGALYRESGQPMRFVDAGESVPEMSHARYVAFLCGDSQHAAFLTRHGNSGATFTLTRQGQHWGSIQWMDGWME